MTLYTLQEKNIRKTWLLMFGFFLLVIALGWFLSYYFESPEIFWFALIFSLLTNFLSYWHSDKIVLALTHARPIKPEENPELYRLVENLTITAGLPMPKLYLMPEKAPNAFATGRDPKHAAIVVTSGLLELLNKPELEGVLAHELSHIGNRDILIQSIVVVLVGLVAALSDFFLRMTFWGGLRKKDEKEGNQTNALIYLLGIILIILAPLIAQIIHFAISRKREFLADASGALLTRYPEGLAQALEKIAASQTPMAYASTATAHLFIANPFQGQKQNSWLVKLFSTHPPIEERIKALREMAF